MKENRVKIFLFGNYRNNAGPENVNRCLLENSMHDFMYIEKRGVITKRIDILNKIFRSNVIVFSGFGSYRFWLFLSKLLHKKTIYLMHGCAQYETKINKLNVKKKVLDFENQFLESVDLVLPVSELYKEWVVQQFPMVENKIHFLNSGIIFDDHCDIDTRIKRSNYDKIRVIVAGGDRIQKNNIEVCKAIEILASRINKKVELQICGRKYYNNDDFLNYPHTISLGMLPNKQFLEKLGDSHVFILNSDVESFGLSAVDALRMGCNILISKNSGVRSILTLEEDDIIFNPHNPFEIADKIEKILIKNNCKRILESIDFNHYSWENVAERLYEISEAVYKCEKYDFIR